MARQSGAGRSTAQDWGRGGNSRSVGCDQGEHTDIVILLLTLFCSCVRSRGELSFNPPSAPSQLPHTLKSLQAPQSRSFLDLFEARGFGGRHARRFSPRQLKEVIQVAHTNVGSVAPRGALVGVEVLR